MLLTSTVLILQEMLEAALVISVLLAFSVLNGLSRRWLWLALGLGPIAALLYARRVAEVSEWFDYRGLEMVNASIQFAICLCIFAFGWLRWRRPPQGHWRLLSGLMALIVTLAMVREGFEILLYASGFPPASEHWPAMMVGSLLGAGIGISAGALLYYALVQLGGQRLLLVLLALFSGNMAAQGTLLLIQADILPSGQPLWSTAAILPEGTLTGQVLYALIGYEATPNVLQVAAYGLGCLLALSLFALAWPPRHGDHHAP